MRAGMLGIVAAVVAGAMACSGGAPARKTEGKPRYFEMRMYTANPGKMEALQKRFRDHANRLLTRHGMEILGHWTVESGEGAGNTYVFILAYPSKEAREASWKAFMADPEWMKAKEESEKAGVLVGKVVQTFMVPLEYSAIQ